jgi:hypothetical protein
MNDKASSYCLGSLQTVCAASVATVIALCILWLVVGFQSRGKPVERVVAAERACAHHADVSERQACMQQWLAARQATRVAGSDGRPN